MQKFGTDTFDVIEERVDLLIEVEGIGNKRIKMIAESWVKPVGTSKPEVRDEATGFPTCALNESST